MKSSKGSTVHLVEDPEKAAVLSTLGPDGLSSQPLDVELGVLLHQRVVPKHPLARGPARTFATRNKAAPGEQSIGLHKKLQWSLMRQGFPPMRCRTIYLRAFHMCFCVLLCDSCAANKSSKWFQFPFFGENVSLEA